MSHVPCVDSASSSTAEEEVPTTAATATATITAATTTATTLLPTPIKGNADWREYRAFRLQNGVTCLVIHDKESKTTGMSCMVNVGASADPRELSGLAHFCEHMCFLGSEKYPGENDYKRFLSNHGGRSNASTSMHGTNYKAEVVAEHAEHALDLFSNFFIGPLFTLSGTSREVNAIDSENSKNLTADGRRRLQILKDLADPLHHYSKFSTGHAGTLNTQNPSQLEWIREALLAFHRKHYRPENMTVVVAGPQSLDTLQEWVVARYSLIPTPPVKPVSEMTPVERLIEEAAAEAPPNTLDQPPPPFRSAFLPALQGGSWPVLLTTKPLKSVRKLVLLWPIPSTDKRLPDQSPSSFLSHLLGHEGLGSVFAVLQNHGMLSSLTAGPRTTAPDFTLFQVDMGLTQKGEQHWQEVVDVVFGYCRRLQSKLALAKQGDEAVQKELQQIWDEMSRLNAMFFHQTSPGGVYNYAPNLAERVHSYGTEKALSAGSMLNESGSTFPIEKVAQLVELFRPDNCIVERCSEGAWDEVSTASPNGSNNDEGFGKRTEKWYGVEYYLTKIDETSQASWKGKSLMTSEVDHSELSLPRPNRYIPRSLELCPELPNEAKHGPRLEKPIDPPLLLIDDDMGHLFHRLDDRYALPQSSLTLLIRNAAVQNIKSSASEPGGDYWEYDDKAALLSSILSGAFSEAMAQETYDADLAGLDWNLSLGASGIKFSFFGFSDRLPDLALTILDAFLSGDFIQESYYESTKDRVIRSLKTYFESRRADSHAVYYRDALLASNDRGIDVVLEIAETATLEEVKSHFQNVLGNPEIALECLFSGNVGAEDSKSFYASASTRIKESQKARAMAASPFSTTTAIPAGVVERRVGTGEDIELHFASKNPEEENGSVVCSYQSSIPGYRGTTLSCPESLRSTAAIRLISHMLREPLFDDLRTKQQLGYVVHAYYELGYSSRPNDEIATLGPFTTPVDFITVAILSRKLPPPEIVNRIDEFMVTFRESLETMPESEIRDHADSLSKKMLKPIQKLQSEASNHFGKIQRYVPELFKKGTGNARDQAFKLPWDSVEPLAWSIRSLTRQDLLETWDRMTGPSTRSRVVSCVYGNTFPLEPTKLGSASLGWRGPQRTMIVNSFSKVVQLRKKLPPFDDRPGVQRRTFSTLLIRAPSTPLLARVGLGCVLGAGAIGLAMAFRNQRRSAIKR